MLGMAVPVDPMAGACKGGPYIAPMGQCRGPDPPRGGRKIKILVENWPISASGPPETDRADQTIHSSGLRMSGEGPES